jgi:hypothetical protein
MYISAVGIAIGYRLEDLGIEIRGGPPSLFSDMLRKLFSPKGKVDIRALKSCANVAAGWIFEKGLGSNANPTAVTL